LPSSSVAGQKLFYASSIINGLPNVLCGGLESKLG